jgi:hypothetical protein
MGYAMFFASAIHFKSLVAQRKLQAHGLGRFKAAISILKRLKEYWTPLQALVGQIWYSTFQARLTMIVVYPKVTLRFTGDKY